MFNNFMRMKNVKDVLKGLVEQRVTIILERGQKLTVEVDAVVDDLLVASIDGKILFINIECICVVVTCCEEALEALLTKRSERVPEEKSECGFKGQEPFKDVSREKIREVQDIEFSF